MDFRLGSHPSMYPSHPMASAYLRTELSRSSGINFQRILKLREEQNCPVPSGLSATCGTVAASPKSREYLSISSLQQNLRKHTRSSCCPSEKYNWGSATSHEVGWFVQPPCSVTLRKPKHGLKESETTRYVHNLKATGSEASLRLILPSP
mmetsp:Transcript_43675/g.89209  ORF Transcript_43675/g.89209 Transcript_43675/m.89209 type:complete len:150 (-) Transcript_43675:70-519(-)